MATRSSLVEISLPVTSDWGIWALLSTLAALAQVSQRTKLGELLSAPLLAIFFGLIFAAAGILPLECAAYNNISSFLLPLAAALYLLESDLRELASTAQETVIAFFLATVGTILGTLVAWKAVGNLLGPDGWKVVSALAASYVGGSVNFAAVSQALGLQPGRLLASAMSADMVAMAAYLVVISSWPVKDKLGQQEEAVISSQHGTSGVTADSVSLSIAGAVLSCALGNLLATALGIPDFALGIIAVIASLLASLGSTSQSSKQAIGSSNFKGAEALGGALMSFFFVTIGASAGSISAILDTGWLIAFIAIQLSVHLAFTMGIGQTLNLSLKALLTASNAAVGGPGTAAAMATSKQWSSMIRPALVVGAFGYSIGTPIGIFLGQALQSIP